MPRFRFEHSSDADTVFRLITNPDELTRRCEELGERNVQVEVSEAGGTTKAQIVRGGRARASGFAKKLFKPKNTLVEREEWRSLDDRYVAKGQLKIVAPGARIDSTIELSPLGSGCVYEIDLQVTAKAPLIRRKLEAFVGDTAIDSLKEQHEYYARRLADRG